MEISNIILHIESLIFASDRPLTSLEITDLVNQAFGFMEDKITPEQIDASINGIIEKYSSEFYPFEIKQSGGGWQFLTKKEFHKTVAQLNGEKFLKRLSAAALETLAIIAYKHPITKGEIEAIRGVSTDYSIQKLLEKELIVIIGRNEKLPGHPLVYATSKNFMDYFGINSPEDLPKIREVLADQAVEPTVVQNPDVEQSENLSVSNDGELIEHQEEGEEPTLNGHSHELEARERHEEQQAPFDEDLIEDMEINGHHGPDTEEPAEEDADISEEMGSSTDGEPDIDEEGSPYQESVDEDNDPEDTIGLDDEEIEINLDEEELEEEDFDDDDEELNEEDFEGEEDEYNDDEDDDDDDHDEEHPDDKHPHE